MDVIDSREIVTDTSPVIKTPSVSLPSTSTVQSAPIFGTTNAISDGVNTLKRIEFEFMGTSYKFSLNPEEYTQQEPSRINVTQTKGGSFVDDFGAGVPIVTFKGSTGFKHRKSDPSVGFTKFKELRDLIRTFYYKSPPGTNITEEKELIFHNYTDGEHWVVYPKTFGLMKSISRPLLYMYDIQLVLLRPASEPATTNPNLSPTLSEVKAGDNTPYPTEVKTAAVDNVNKNISPTLPPTIKNVTKNINTALAVSHALLNKSTAGKIVEICALVSPGNLLTGNSNTSIINSNSTTNMLSLVTKVAPAVYTLYKSISSNDEKVVNQYDTTAVSSPLLLNLKGQPNLIKTAVHALYLDLFALQKDLLSTVGDKLTETSKADVIRISGNIRWIIAKINCDNTGTYNDSTLTLLEILADCLKAVSALSTQSSVLNDTYKTKFDEYQGLLGGTSDV